MKFFIVNAVVLLGLVSCVRELPSSPEGASKKIVVNCLLVNKDTQTLKLTYSGDINSKGLLFSEVTNAEITLFENNNSVGKFYKDGYSIWKIKLRPKVGATYSIEVNVPDYPELSAKTTMPEEVKISSEGATDYGFTKSFSEEKGSALYWIFCLTSEKDITPIPEPPGDYEKFQDIIGTSNPYTDRFNQDGSLADFSSFGNTPAYKFYIRTVVDANASAFDFTVQSNHAKTSYVVFQSTSKEYDEYLKTTLSKMFMYQDEDDPIRYFDENVVYSNITNGLGIFGAYNETWFLYN